MFPIQSFNSQINLVSIRQLMPGTPHRWNYRARPVLGGAATTLPVARFRRNKRTFDPAPRISCFCLLKPVSCAQLMIGNTRAGTQLRHWSFPMTVGNLDKISLGRIPGTGGFELYFSGLWIYFDHDWGRRPTIISHLPTSIHRLQSPNCM